MQQLVATAPAEHADTPLPAPAAGEHRGRKQRRADVAEDEPPLPTKAAKKKDYGKAPWKTERKVSDMFQFSSGDYKVVIFMFDVS